MIRTGSYVYGAAWRWERGPTRRRFIRLYLSCESDHPMNRFFIYFAVIICGASVLAIELLGTRVIAPFYGASLYLWSALISVTLAALSVGYAVGGRWADRDPQLKRFCLVIALAGIWVSFIPWLRIPVLAAAESFGLRTAVLVTATILFFPPLALLGMVSPYAIRLKVQKLTEVGRTAGNLYAVSTLASVFAAIATGFWLIPHIGVSRLLLLIGLLLVGTAALGWFGRGKIALLFGVPAVLAGAALASCMAPHVSPDPESGILAIEESPYSEIRIIEMEGGRFMFIDGSFHSGIDLQTNQSLFEYVDVLDIPKYFFDEPGRMLTVGLGGGSVVKSYANDNWKVQAVEIDPVVTKLAKAHFNLMDADAEIIHMDGRQFLLSTDATYQVVIMDAFGSSSIPFHLATEESFGLIRQHLTDDGILAVNVQCVGWHDQIVHSLAATANRVFAHVYALPIAEPPDQLGNLILLSSDRDLNLATDLPQPSYRVSPEYNRAHAWDNRFVVDTSGVLILTDELNPVDVWSERVNLASRRKLHEYLKGKPLAW